MKDFDEMLVNAIDSLGSIPKKSGLPLKVTVGPYTSRIYYDYVREVWRIVTSIDAKTYRACDQAPDGLIEFLQLALGLPYYNDQVKVDFNDVTPDCLPLYIDKKVVETGKEFESFRKLVNPIMMLIHDLS